MKGFKEIKTSPAASPTSDTATTDVASTQTTIVAADIKPKLEPVEKEIKIEEEHSKSSESDLLSEEDSSQSSNKAFSSSPITAAVDSDTAEDIKPILGKINKSVDTNQSKIIEKVVEKTLEKGTVVSNKKVVPKAFVPSVTPPPILDESPSAVVGETSKFIAFNETNTKPKTSDSSDSVAVTPPVIEEKVVVVPPPVVVPPVIIPATPTVAPQSPKSTKPTTNIQEKPVVNNIPDKVSPIVTAAPTANVAAKVEGKYNIYC